MDKKADVINWTQHWSDATMNEWKKKEKKRKVNAKISSEDYKFSLGCSKTGITKI